MNVKRNLRVLLIFTLFSAFLVEQVAADTNSNQSTDSETSEALCSDLGGMEIPEADIGLPTSGATITSASLEIADDLAIENAEYCEVSGAIHPVDSDAPDINF